MVIWFLKQNPLIHSIIITNKRKSAFNNDDLMDDQPDNHLSHAFHTSHEHK